MNQLPYLISGLKLMYNEIQREFWIGFSANFLATLLAALLLYILIERRVKDFQTQNEKIKLLRNLLTELITNYVISERIIENEPKSLITDSFPIARFKFTHLNNFLYARPIEDEKKFYLTLSSLATNMEMANSLMDTIFLSSDGKAIIENKKTVIEMAPRLSTQINNLLVELGNLNKKIKFSEEIEKPSKEDLEQ